MCLVIWSEMSQLLIQDNAQSARWKKSAKPFFFIIAQSFVRQHVTHTVRPDLFFHHMNLNSVVRSIFVWQSLRRCVLYIAVFIFWNVGSGYVVAIKTRVWCIASSWFSKIHWFRTTQFFSEHLNTIVENWNKWQKWLLL
jgi:hypothetical protein